MSKSSTSSSSTSKTHKKSTSSSSSSSFVSVTKSTTNYFTANNNETCSLLSVDGAIANDLHRKLQQAFSQLSELKNEIRIKNQIIENKSRELVMLEKSCTEYRTLHSDEQKMRLFWQKRADSLNSINENVRKLYENEKLKRNQKIKDMRWELVQLNRMIDENVGKQNNK